jgi:hypothetical protein
MRSEERPGAQAAVLEDDRGRLAVDAGMLVFLVGLALLFVAGAPS